MAENMQAPRKVLEYKPPDPVPATFVANDQSKINKIDHDNEWLVQRIKWAYQQPSQLMNYRMQKPPEIVAQTYTVANERLKEINSMNQIINNEIIAAKSRYDRNYLADQYSKQKSIQDIHQNVARTYAVQRKNRCYSPQPQKEKGLIVWHPEGNL